MNKLAIIAMLFSAISTANAGTDFQCLSDCTGRGYMYQYCSSKCSYSDSFNQQPSINQQPQYPRPPKTDFQCMSDCGQKGYMHQYCQQRCSY